MIKSAYPEEYLWKLEIYAETLEAQVKEVSSKLETAINEQHKDKE